jgi:hypothetical protein
MRVERLTLGKRWFSAALVVLLCGLATGHAWAQAPAEQTGAPAYSVQGFRSAHFGMSEAEVRKAIAADFKLDDKAIARETNQLERTTILAATVPELLAGAGPARVTYIFGFNRQKLIQVNILWTAPKKDGAASSLGGPGATLRNYFLGFAFKGEAARDKVLPDGSVLLFQGGDEKGRVVALLAGEGVIEDARAKSNDPQWYLRLSYVEDPVKPDVFRLKPGSF